VHRAIVRASSNPICLPADSEARLGFYIKLRTSAELLGWTGSFLGSRCRHVRSVISTDFDGDQKADLTVANHSSSSVSVLLNTTKPNTTQCTKTGTSSGETILGTSGADVICAAGGNDTIKGLGGNDILKGKDGNDKLLGGVGDDTLDGEIGSDTASYSASLTAVNASLATNASMGEGSDTFSGVENLLGSSKPIRSPARAPTTCLQAVEAATLSAGEQVTTR
jgi:Ca2+-binding RTX toxin-like protein